MSQEEIRTIGVRDIPKYQAREDVIWIDVREREEYLLYHIPGAKTFHMMIWSSGKSDWIKVRPTFFTVKEEVLA